MYQINSRVRYSEVNSEKQLTLTALLDYLQDCCTFQGEDLGVGVDYLMREHVAWVLSSWEIEVIRYPQLGEKITVGTWPYEFKGFYGSRNFLVLNEAGEVLVKANSLWVFMDTEKMRPTKVNEDFMRVYGERIEAPLEGTWGERKIAIPHEGEVQTAIKVVRHHIDTNHHMNNSKYVQVAEEYLPDDWTVDRLRVEYKKAAMLGDILIPRVIASVNKITVVLSDGADKPCAVVEFSHK